MNLKPSVRRAGAAATAVAAGLVAAVQVSGPAAAAARPIHTARVSVSTTGAQADNSTISGDQSADGRFVVFESYASTLVPGDTNDTGDVFLRDRLTGTTTRLSVSATGEQGNGASGSPQISADGRYVTFVSFATNFAPNPRPDSGYDAFLLDRRTGKLTRITQTADGLPGNGDTYNPSISADGRYVAFQTYADNLIPGVGGANVLVYDRTTGQLSPISVAADGTAPEGGGSSPSISANGRYVAFISWAALVPEDTNGVAEVYVRDRVAGTTVRASVANDGSQIAGDSRGGVVSDNGRVAFWSEDSTLVAGDTNERADVFVRDLTAGTTTRVSTSATGAESNNYTGGPEITPDGRYVVFDGAASNLVANDTNGVEDVFRKDLRTGAVTLVSRRADGTQANGASVNGSITPDGRTIVFGTFASNLAAGDTNDEMDLYVTNLIG